MAFIYRHFWLYPIINLNLRGQTLDIGCGIGDMLRARKNTIGVDINSETVDYCQRLGLDARTMEIDRLPFEAASFDSAILDNVLEHIKEPTPLLTEVRRVLRPGGRLIVGVPGERGYAADPDHKVYYDKDTLKNRLVECGFRSIRTLQMPLPITALSRKLTSYCIYGVFETSENI